MEEDRIDRARRRFKAMLANAEDAADRASQEHPAQLLLSGSLVTAMKFMDRAGGFLEAVSIIHPELGAELTSRFESFAAKIEYLQASHGDVERRFATPRRARSDRRGWDRRLGRDRRRQIVEVVSERRVSVERRDETDRRTGKIRELADRRLRALHR
jgi:hypothetical protein